MFAVTHLRDGEVLEKTSHESFDSAFSKKRTLLNEYLTSGDYEITELALSLDSLKELEDFLMEFNVFVTISKDSKEFK